MTTDAQNILDFVKLALQFGVVPIIIGLFKLNNSIKDLTITLHKDFQTRSDAGIAMDYVNDQLDKKANKRR